MSNIFLIGATGGVGSRLSPKLVEAGHTVKGLHRKPEQADDLRKLGVEPILGNIIDMTADDIAGAMKGCPAPPRVTKRPRIPRLPTACSAVDWVET